MFLESRPPVEEVLAQILLLPMVEGDAAIADGLVGVLDGLEVAVDE